MSGLLGASLGGLRNVDGKKAKLLEQELGVVTVEDLLSYYPRRYVDRTRMYKIGEVRGVRTPVQIVARLESTQVVGVGPKRRLVAEFVDDTGRIEGIWFRGIQWIYRNMKLGSVYLLFGQVTEYNRSYNMVHPEMELYTPGSARHPPVEPVYETSDKMKRGGLNSRGLMRLMYSVLQQVGSGIPEFLPTWLVEQYSLPSRVWAVHQVHFPESSRAAERAVLRLKFDELFLLQVQLQGQRERQMQFEGHVFETVGPLFNRLYREGLPFDLTGAQKRVLREIRLDTKSGRQMNRLLQGDVGSGKTLVALFSMLLAADNGYQSCMMAPTEILAQQHYASLSRFLKDMPVRVGLLTGSTPAGARRELLEALQDGSLEILVGTHALIEDRVQYRNLGLVVVDEQQRFGVDQRARLWGKAKALLPHVLIMTATPIPRTLALTLYGDLDVSVIDELPPGRQPVQTIHCYDSKREKVYEMMRAQIAQGRQVYVVYPLIRESEALDFESLEKGYEAIVAAFPPPAYSCVFLHGQMSAEEKEEAMGCFERGEAQILVSTTVIEVGVDVPNATMMVIESAQRFGLSQLHQLRGRVGRGAEASYCVLMTGVKLSRESRQRMATMVGTTDGFKIAEADLQLRGAGDLEGTQQSGIPLKLRLANLATDGKLLGFARRVAGDLYKRDPTLSAPEHAALAERVALWGATQSGYSKIG